MTEGFTPIPFFSLESHTSGWSSLLEKTDLPALVSDIELTLSHALLSLVGMVVFPIIASVQGGAIGFALGISSIFFLRKFMLIQKDIRSFKQTLIASNLFLKIRAGIFSSVEIKPPPSQQPFQNPQMVSSFPSQPYFPFPQGGFPTQVSNSN